MAEKCLKLNKDDQPVCAQLLQSENDPLEGMDVLDLRPKYHKLDEVVFAEPISCSMNKDDNSINEDNATKDANEVSFIENVMIHKRSGKRNKYFVDIDLSDLRCPQMCCNRAFSSTTLLKAHIRRVHCADRSFICEQCGATFTAKYLLQRHMAVHDRGKVECPVCYKLLSKRTGLRVHLRSHADTRAHRCPQCRRAFLRRATLAAHLRRLHRDQL